MTFERHPQSKCHHDDDGRAEDGRQELEEGRDLQNAGREATTLEDGADTRAKDGAKVVWTEKSSGVKPRNKGSELTRTFTVRSGESNEYISSSLLRTQCQVVTPITNLAQQLANTTNPGNKSAPAIEDTPKQVNKIDNTTDGTITIYQKVHMEK